VETPDAQPLTCQELVELVTDYLEGAMPQADRARFDEHLTTCPYCRIYLEQMRQTVRLLGNLPEEAISPGALEALLARLRRWRS
jgi:predicted anti-sigma-YlaC factor YlaD